MNWETILCLGDSITIGSRSYLGYPEYCGNILEERTNKSWNVINCAVAGYTSIDLTRHVTVHFDNLKASRPSITCLLIGTNDLKSNTSEADFTIAYNQLVIKALLLTEGKNVTLLTIPYLGKGVMLPYKYEMNVKIDTYNAIITQIARRYRLPTLKIEVADDHYYDGVHLNGDGSSYFAEQLALFILRNRGL